MYAAMHSDSRLLIVESGFVTHLSKAISVSFDKNCICACLACSCCTNCSTAAWFSWFTFGDEPAAKLSRQKQTMKEKSTSEAISASYLAGEFDESLKSWLPKV